MLINLLTHVPVTYITLTLSLSPKLRE